MSAHFHIPPAHNAMPLKGSYAASDLVRAIRQEDSGVATASRLTASWRLAPSGELQCRWTSGDLFTSN